MLQRIALCYFLASVIVIGFGMRGAGVAVVALLLGYALLVALVPAPAGYTADVTGPEGLLHDWLTPTSSAPTCTGERPDPEGLLSTLPATATTLLGLLTGWCCGARVTPTPPPSDCSSPPGPASSLGLCLDALIPLNKKIWTSSYVIFTAGLALHVLATCYWLIDVRGWSRWSAPLLVFGSNAIVVFVASSLVARTLHRWRLGNDGPSIAAWLYETTPSPPGPHRKPHPCSTPSPTSSSGWP